MRVYFVRHGQTDANAQQVYQPEDMPLNEQGRAQAEFVAERFKSIPIGAIFSSDLPRALTTAHTVSKSTGVEVVPSDLLREGRRPTAIIGLSHHDPEAERIREIMLSREDYPDWHHSDEENFYDLRRRGERALTMIKECGEENVLVVTHGMFLWMLVGIMQEGAADLTPGIFWKIVKFFASSNTGITMCEWDGTKWWLLTWNDHAHLGEVSDSAHKWKLK